MIHFCYHLLLNISSYTYQQKHDRKLLPASTTYSKFYRYNRNPVHQSKVHYLSNLQELFLCSTATLSSENNRNSSSCFSFVKTSYDTVWKLHSGKCTDIANRIKSIEQGNSMCNRSNYRNSKPINAVM